jgi:hypothetical protein
MAILTNIRKALWDSLASLDVASRLTPQNSHLFYSPNQRPSIGQLPALEMIPKSVSTNWTHYQLSQIDYVLTVNIYADGFDLIKLEWLWQQAAAAIYNDVPLSQLLSVRPVIGSPSLVEEANFNIWTFTVTLSTNWNPLVPQVVGTKHNFESGVVLTDVRHVILDSIQDSIGSDLNKIYRYEVKGPNYSPTIGDLPCLRVVPNGVTTPYATNNPERFVQYGLQVDLITKWYEVEKGEDLWERMVAGLYANQRTKIQLGSPVWAINGTTITFPVVPQMTLWSVSITTNTLWAPAAPTVRNMDS